MAPTHVHYNPATAARELGKRDKSLGRLIRQAGPCSLAPEPTADLFASLAEAIISQQLSGKAAQSIHERFRRLFEALESTPLTTQVLETSPETLRDTGLSRAKVTAVRDLAERIERGEIPAIEQLRRMDDDTVIASLTQVKGIGRWTVEMFLIFQLGRPDVLPLDDLGVRKGFMQTYELPELPSRQTLSDHGEQWRPYRSVASWYLWRATEL